MKYYAVIDTNVLLSALLSKNEDSATVRVLDFIVTPAEMMAIMETEY